MVLCGDKPAYSNALPQGEVTMHPVPDQPFSSVCSDIFTHTKEKNFRGQMQDKIVLIVCRHSGYAVAWSDNGTGLAAEKVAKEYAE